MLSSCVQRFPKTPVPIDLSFHIFHQTHNDDLKIIQEPEQEKVWSESRTVYAEGRAILFTGGKTPTKSPAFVLIMLVVSSKHFDSMINNLTLLRWNVLKT